jgi:DNA-binding transcriptional LysR family regulator
MLRTPLPVPGDGLDVTVLYDEPRALLVPASHRLAGEESVTPDDFADEPLVACAGMAALWTGSWRLDPRPDGTPVPVGPLLVDTFEDKLEVVADGRAIALVPADDRRCTLRDDLVTVPVEGIDPCQVVVATRSADANPPLVAHFLASAKSLLVREARHTLAAEAWRSCHDGAGAVGTGHRTRRVLALRSLY